MRISLFKNALLFCMFFIVAPSAVHAIDDLCNDRLVTAESDQLLTADQKGCFLFGGGSFLGSTPYRSNNVKSGFPIIIARYNKFYWDTNVLGMYMLGNQSLDSSWGFAARLLLPSGGFAQSDNRHLEGLADRDATLEGGLYLVGSSDWGYMDLAINFDLEEVHDGVNGAIGYGYTFKLNELTLVPSISLRYHDVKNVGYYFGVNAEESDVTELAEYEASEPSYSVAIAYSISYVLNKQISFFHSTELLSYDNIVGDSPLSVRDNVFSTSVGGLFRLY